MCRWERKSICKSPSSQTRIEESRRSVLASSISGKFMSVQAETLILMIWNLGNVNIVLHQRRRGYTPIDRQWWRLNRCYGVAVATSL